MRPTSDASGRISNMPVPLLFLSLPRLVRPRSYGVEDVVMIVSKASLTERTEEICMDEDIQT